MKSVILLFALVIGTLSVSKDCLVDIATLGLELGKTYVDAHTRPWSLPLDLIAVARTVKATVNDCQASIFEGI